MSQGKPKYNKCNGSDDDDDDDDNNNNDYDNDSAENDDSIRGYSRYICEIAVLPMKRESP